MRKYNLIVIAFAVLAAITGIIVGIILFNKKVNVINIKPSFSIEAIALFNEFSNDEKAATAKYVGKTGDNIIIEVFGKIGGISEQTGKTYVLIGEEMNGVSCELDDSQKQAVAGLKKGDEIKIKGQCDGILMEVNMKRCFISNIK